MRESVIRLSRSEAFCEARAPQTDADARPLPASPRMVGLSVDVTTAQPVLVMPLTHAFDTCAPMKTASSI